MTAQIPDRIRIGRRTLSIQGVRGDSLFDPTSLGWQLTSPSTACWRGYVATYGLQRDMLVLVGLDVCLALRSLVMKEPFFVVDVEEPSGRTARHEVFDFTARVGDEPDCTIVISGEPIRLLTLLDRTREFLLGTAGPGYRRSQTRVADGAVIAIGAHTLRPSVVAGANARYTADLPLLAGREGRWTHAGMLAGSVAYRRLRIPVAFTGMMLGCSDFLQQHYAHMGFHPAWKFEHVEELVFESGKLVHHEDVSEKLAKVREVLVKSRPPHGALPAEVDAWVKRTFSREY